MKRPKLSRERLRRHGGTPPPARKSRRNKQTNKKTRQPSSFPPTIQPGHTPQASLRHSPPSSRLSSSPFSVCRCFPRRLSSLHSPRQLHYTTTTLAFYLPPLRRTLHSRLRRLHLHTPTQSLPCVPWGKSNFVGFLGTAAGDTLPTWELACTVALSF